MSTFKRNEPRRMWLPFTPPPPAVPSTRDRRDGRHTHYRHFGRPPFADDPRAACRGRDVDPSWWFAPEREDAGRGRPATNPKDAARAKRICKRCPLQQPCLVYALEAGEPFGIWGGLDPEERGVAPDRGRRPA